MHSQQLKNTNKHHLDEFFWFKTPIYNIYLHFTFNEIKVDLQEGLEYKSIFRALAFANNIKRRYLCFNKSFLL